MSGSTILASEFNVENVVLSKFQPNKDSGTGTVRVGYRYSEDSEPERLVVQSARMRAPFGLSSNEKFAKEGDNLKWTLQVSFDGEEKNKKIQKFRKFIEDFDNHITSVGLQHADEWINDDDPDEKTIKKAYKSALKKFKPKKGGSDSVYSDTFKISIPWDPSTDEPRSNIEFFDEQGNTTSWTDITPGCEVVALFAINGIWCSPGISSFGPSVKLVQLQVFKPKKIKGFNIKYDKESDDESAEESSAEAEDDIEEYESE